MAKMNGAVSTNPAIKLPKDLSPLDAVRVTELYRQFCATAQHENGDQSFKLGNGAVEANVESRLSFLKSVSWKVRSNDDRYEDFHFRTTRGFNGAVKKAALGLAVNHVRFEKIVGTEIAFPPAHALVRRMSGHEGFEQVDTATLDMAA